VPPRWARFSNRCSEDTQARLDDCGVFEIDLHPTHTPDSCKLRKCTNEASKREIAPALWRMRHDSFARVPERDISLDEVDCS
jgi:hypothetical protein